MYTQGGILSADGKCKPFDASANGYVTKTCSACSELNTGSRFGRGEGAVVIVLKPLHSALRDHDHIYATVSWLIAPPAHSIIESIYRFWVLG